MTTCRAACRRCGGCASSATAHEPTPAVRAFVLSLLAALPDALLALWLKLLGEGVLEHNAGARARRRGRASASPPPATWFLRTVSTRVQRRFRDKVTIALESHVARLQASVADDRPPGAARVPRPARGAARPGLRARPHVHVAVLDLRLDPAARRDDRAARCRSTRRWSCWPCSRCPTVLTSTWRPGGRARRRRSAARQSNRLARHLFTLATTAPPGKEVRVTGIGERLVAERRARVGALVRPGRRHAAGARRPGTRWPGRSSARAYVGAVVFVAAGLGASAGDVLLVLAAGARLSAYIGATVGEIGFLRGIWLDGSRGWPGSRTTPRRWSRTPTCRCPTRLDAGHPPRARLVRLSRHRAPRARRRQPRAARRRGRRHRRRERRRQDAPWSSCSRKLYEPTRGAHLRRRRSRCARMPADAWRDAAGRRVPGLLPLRVPRPPHRRPRRRAAPRRRAGGRTAPSTAPAPTTWSRACRPGSRRSSGRPGPTASRCRFGQWQKLALARGFMRDEPLLLVLDEPTAALDAETEHALFERYAAAAREATARNGRDHDPGLAPLQHRAHGRPHRRARRRARRRGRHATTS